MKNTTTRAGSEDSAQISLFDELLSQLNKAGGKISSAQITTVIEKLRSARSIAKKREDRERAQQQATSPAENPPPPQPKDHIQEVTSMDLPMDWENLFAGDVRAEGVHADSIPDGLILSLSNLGRVDMEYISSITGADLKTVISTLKGSVYQNPDTWDECFYKGWETAEAYLSGNMVQKWKAAKAANEKYKGYFADNVTAIERVLPPSLSAEDIYITLGSPWVPTDIIDAFIRHILKVNACYSCTTHDPYTGSWEISNKSFYANRVACRSTYGTEKLTALYILERTLNMKTVCVTDEVSCSSNKSGKKRVINQSETVAVLEKQKKLIEEFQKWVWKDPERKARLELIFENNFGCVRKRHFDGSFLTFPTMNPEVQLYPYQKDAAARILFSPNTLLAHDVGSGKTYVMIAAGQELRRMWLSKKNLYVVPNNLVGQWKNIFLKLYPTANILCVEPKSFTPAKRESVLQTIRDKDFDGIIMAYSCFESIGLSHEHYIRELEQTRDEVKKLLKNAGKVTNKLRRKAKSVDEELCKAITNVLKTDQTIFFEELGITRLFVDEAHNFKNVPIETQVGHVLGISAGGSKKCQDMMDKVRLIQKNNGGGGVVMATGTPITNSVTDAYIMQKYLQSGELAMLDLQSFDSWIGMFAEKVTEFEIDVDTSSYRLATRFAKFHNLPELTTMLASIADFHQVDITDGIPSTDGYSDSLIGKTAEFADYLKTISQRADDVRQGRVPRTQDNMLKITTDGRQAALDLRLVDPASGFTYQSKVARCAENVWDIYQKTRAQKSTQLIFCDSSTPKKGFNMYDELYALLFSMGIPMEEMAFIHHANTEKRREKLFRQVQNGQVRVLIGSTFKLGLGVNVQNKLIAIHHLDVPWRPADMTQREGRILRQGNENKTVQIFRYITEGSFDAYSWQLLETKQRFIVGLLSGSLEDRSGSDIEDTVLSYAEVKALAVGNPLVKERVETANELSRLLTLQRKSIENHIAMEKELSELPGKMQRQEGFIEKCREDAAFMEKTFVVQDKEIRRQLRKTLYDAVCANVLSTKETPLMTYQGFLIVLPTNMSREKPYVWLQRQGRYYVELGDSEVGCLIRLDNALENLPNHLTKLQNNLEEMQQRELALQIELTKQEDFSEQITACKEKIAKLDKKLGVDKK
ncbi:MAG: hypothetical protein E7447_02580 [Ruminococcaceae bacterium]|nr:hypothetical protein [Oscillospiraceae bacterium]